MYRLKDFEVFCSLAKKLMRNTAQKTTMSEQRGQEISCYQTVSARTFSMPQCWWPHV